MSRIVMDLPEEAAEALKVPKEHVGDELRPLAAIKLFEIGRLSSGAAARLAGIARVLFLKKLGDYRVNTFDMSEEELRQDASKCVR